jgi:hypothetical protein
MTKGCGKIRIKFVFFEINFWVYSPTVNPSDCCTGVKRVYMMRFSEVSWRYDKNKGEAAYLVRLFIPIRKAERWACDERVDKVAIENAAMSCLDLLIDYDASAATRVSYMY